MYSSSISYFEILGVDPSASMDEIKAAYRKLAMRWHPDRHQNDSKEERDYAERMFKLINEAYHSISNGTAYSNSQSEERYYDSESDTNYYGDDNSTYAETPSWFNIIASIATVLLYVALGCAAVFLLIKLVQLILWLLPIILIVGLLGAIAIIILMIII